MRKMNSASKSIFKNLFLHLLCLAPFAIIAGLFDYRFHQYYWSFLNILRPVRPPPMFDFFGVMDFHTIFILIFYCLGVLIYKLNVPTKKWRWFYLSFISIFAGAAISAIYYSPVEPIIKSAPWHLISQYAAPIALFLVILFSLREKIWQEKFLRNMLAAFSLLGLMSLLEFFTNILPGANKDFLGRLVWPYIDPFAAMKPESANWMAYLFGPMTILSFIRLSKNWAHDKFNRANALNIISFLICGTTLLLTKSYTGIIITFILISWRLFTVLPRQYKKWLALGIAIIFIAAILTQYKTPKFQILLGNYKKENSMERRVQIYKFTLEAFKQKSVTGIGAANYQSFFRQKMGNYIGAEIPEEELPPHPHNLLANAWSDLGLFGLIGFLIIYVVTAKQLIFKPRGGSLYLVFAYFLGHGLTDTPYGLTEISTLFWVILSMAVLVDFEA